MTGKPGTKCTSPDAEARDLVVRVRDDARALAGTRPCSAGGCCRGGRARRACPARARCPACARGSALRPAGAVPARTPSACAAHWRVWSSGVAPMPPQENTTSPEAKARRSVAVMRSGASPTYSAQASCRPRAASSSITLGMCLSARLPERISSPTMTRPNQARGVQARGDACVIRQC